jgi:hypothetical protein
MDPTVEKIGWESDNPFNVTSTDGLSADIRLGIAPEENAMGHDDRPFPVVLSDARR